MKSFVQAGLGLLGSMILAEGAIAHGVTIQTEISPTVEVIGRYEDGLPIKQAQVKVFSSENPDQPQFTGVTDDQGRFFFQPTEPGEWEVFIRQAGHGGKTSLVIEDTDQSGLVIANTPTGHSWPQRLLMIGTVLWGCIGTALYFKGRSA